MSIATTSTPSSQLWRRCSSHEMTSWAERPSTWPSSPWPPSRSTKPVCQESAICSQTPFPLAASGLVDAQTFERFRLGGQTCVNASDTTGQERPWSRPDWAMVRPASTTATPAARPQPAGQARTGGYLRHRLGERRPRTRRLLAVLAALAPHQPHRCPAARQIPREGPHMCLRTSGDHLAAWAPGRRPRPR